MTEGINEETRRTTKDSGAITGSATDQQTREEQKGPPYDFRAAAIALVAASLVFPLTA